ncbi:hypothetical protein pb186bvf_014038 [Paramecium bursaria]
MSSQNRVFLGRFSVIKRISSGSFGVVYLVHDKTTKEDCALKLEKYDNDETRSLEKEVSILTKLNDTPGVPKLIWAGQEGDFNLLIMQLLGMDLGYYIKQFKQFTLKCTIQIAYESVQVLRNIHSKQVVHRDLKPENILMSKDVDQIYIVDFGISKIFTDMPFRDDKSFMGTTRYASIAAHKGFEIARKDDLESLFYVIIYFLRGNLPWQNLQVQEKDRTTAVGELKQKIELNELCNGLPHEFVEILAYLRTLSFYEEPDYTFILGLLSQVADRHNFFLDGTYDWTDQSRLTKKQSSIDTRKSLEFQRGFTDAKMKDFSPKNYMKSQSSKLTNQVIWSVNDQGFQGSQKNMLLVPDRHLNPNQRSDVRHFSNSSSNMSNQGSWSSMRIRYMPSINENQLPLAPKPQVQKEILYSEYMEENFDDIPVIEKIKLIQNPLTTEYLKMRKFTI